MKRIIILTILSIAPASNAGRHTENNLQVPTIIVDDFNGTKLPCMFFNTYPSYPNGLFICADQASSNTMLSSILTAKSTSASVSFVWDDDGTNTNPETGTTSTKGKLFKLWFN